MKMRFIVLSVIVLVFVGEVFPQKQAVSPAKTELLQTNYFIFQENPALNAHLFLYNKAMAGKFKKIPDDSLAYYSFKDKMKSIPAKELPELNSALIFYRDSLLAKDLLFDSLMRNFSDKVGNPDFVTTKWQTQTLAKVNVFFPYFLKLYWPAIDAENKTWIKTNKDAIIRLETSVVPELERIYQMKLPKEKVLVDLTNYATWAGAYSYNDVFCHIVFSSAHRSNQGELAPEVVFHEASHFLVDKLEQQIKVASKGKDLKQSINLWHNMIFYTTGYVLEKQYAKENKMFFPYYVQMKFEDKFPDFKASVEACKNYWNAYSDGKTTMEEAVKSIVNDVTSKK